MAPHTIPRARATLLLLLAAVAAMALDSVHAQPSGGAQGEFALVTAEDETLVGPGHISDLRFINHHLFLGQMDPSTSLRVLVVGDGSYVATRRIAQDMHKHRMDGVIMHLDDDLVALEHARDMVRQAETGNLLVMFVMGRVEEMMDHDLGQFDYIHVGTTLAGAQSPMRFLTSLASKLSGWGGIGLHISSARMHPGTQHFRRMLNTLWFAQEGDEHVVDLTQVRGVAHRLLASLPETNWMMRYRHDEDVSANALDMLVGELLQDLTTGDVGRAEMAAISLPLLQEMGNAVNLTMVEALPHRSGTMPAQQRTLPGKLLAMLHGLPDERKRMFSESFHGATREYTVFLKSKWNGVDTVARVHDHEAVLVLPWGPLTSYHRDMEDVDLVQTLCGSLWQKDEGLARSFALTAIQRQILFHTNSKRTLQEMYVLIANKLDAGMLVALDALPPFRDFMREAKALVAMLDSLDCMLVSNNLTWWAR